MNFEFCDYIFPKDGEEDAGDSDADIEAYDDDESYITFRYIRQILEEYEVED